MHMRRLLLCALNLGSPLLKQNSWWKLPPLATPKYQQASRPMVECSSLGWFPYWFCHQTPNPPQAMELPHSFPSLIIKNYQRHHQTIKIVLNHKAILFYLTSLANSILPYISFGIFWYFWHLCLFGIKWLLFRRANYFWFLLTLLLGT